MVSGICEVNNIEDKRQQAKDITSRVQNKREKGDSRVFKDILQEELKREMSSDKFDDNWTIKEKATKDTGK